MNGLAFPFLSPFFFVLFLSSVTRTIVAVLKYAPARATFDAAVVDGIRRHADVCTPRTTLV